MTGAVWRVLPDVPAVDRAFDYRAVPGVDPPIGTVVRVELHGRRVRGWLLERPAEPAVPEAELRTARAVVSAGPPAALVELCQWAAWRWAGPRAAFLRAASPPQIVRWGEVPAEPDVAVHPVAPALVELPAGPRRLVLWPPTQPRGALVASLLAAEGSTIVCAPQRGEHAELAETVRATGRSVVELHGDAPAADRTEAWREARRGACVVIGGRAAAFTPVRR